MSQRIFRAAVVGIGALGMTASPAFGFYQHGWESYSEYTYLYTNTYAHYIAGDSVLHKTDLYWDAGKAFILRYNARDGRYFTLDTRDDERSVDHNLDAWYIWSNVGQPFYDFDDEDGVPNKNEEAEVVAESASFPTAGVWYTVQSRWSHTYNVGTDIHWDPSSGRLYTYENMSLWTVCCWPLDKYDTDPWFGSAPLGYEPYPYRAGPSGVPAANTPPEGSVTDAVTQPPPQLVAVDGHISSELERYIADARSRSRAAVSNGASRGVVTFSRPLQASEVAAVERLGAEVHNIEGATTPGESALRFSFYGANEPAVWGAARHDAALAGVKVLGATSAEVTVPSLDALDALEADPRVLSIDIASVEGLATTGGRVPPDVFWQYAGW